MVSQTIGDCMTELKGSNEQSDLVIKKYANRKFYDTESSCYVSLTEIQDIVRNGRSIRVIDNVDKNDITKKTLAASLSESISKSESFSLNDIISLIKKSKL